MILDTRSIILSFAVNGFFVSAMIIAFARGENDRVNQTLRIFGLGCLVSITGWLLIALRGYVADFLSVIVGNLLLMIGNGEIMQSFFVFNEDQPRRRWTYLVFGLATIFNLVFLYGFDNYNARVICNSLILFGIGFICVVCILRLPAQINPVLRWSTIFAFVVQGAINAARLVVAVQSPYSSTSQQLILANNPFEATFFLLVALNVSLVVIGFTLICQDYQASQFRLLSMLDSLTGLYNRREFESLALAAINHAQRFSESLCMLLTDADDFKHINDTYGHETGDAALKHLAALLRSKLRTQDIICRFGGDEFAILLPGIDEEHGQMLVQRITRLIEDTPFCRNDTPIQLKASIGLAALDPQMPVYNDLYHRADIDLYEQKRIRKSD